MINISDLEKLNFIRVSSVDSTNQYALSLKTKDLFKEGLVIAAKYQYKGRGQRDNIWESEDGKNLIFSLVIEPQIPISEQFIINKIACISVVKFLLKFGVEATIKWPNDILFSNHKLAGILIENIVSKGLITHSVIGIGLNVNQLVFDDYVPKAISLALVLDDCFDLEEIQHAIIDSIRDEIIAFRAGLDLDSEYLNMLYKKDQVVLFESKSERFYGIIRGVNSRGLIIIEADNSVKNFNLKEIKMIF